MTEIINDLITTSIHTFELVMGHDCSVCEVEITPVIDNTFEFPAFDAENP